MKVWERRLIVALVALAFALLIYSYFTDKSVYYSPGVDYSDLCMNNLINEIALCPDTVEGQTNSCVLKAVYKYWSCDAWCQNHFC